MSRPATIETERFLGFMQCPGCSYDLVTGEGDRSCHYYECPSLPEELDATCPTCNYSFTARDTHRACEGSEPCDFARYEAVDRLHNLHRWAEQHPAG